MRKTLIATTLASLSALPMLAAAADAPASPHTFTGNLTIASDYRFRGISQTFKEPAVQGGIDYSHASGFYLGTWLSNVSGVQYPNGAGLEMDIYGGYKFEIAKDTMLDLGVLHYYYPGAKYNVLGDKFDNTELYVGASWKWLSAKYSYTTSDFFGTKTSTYGGACENAAVGGNAANCIPAAPGGSKGSGYLDVSAAYPLSEKLTLIAHIGHQKVSNYGQLDYTDWKLGLNYDLNGWTLGAAYIDTNANKGFYNATNGTGDVKKLAESTVVVSVSKTF